MSLKRLMFIMALLSQKCLVGFNYRVYHKKLLKRLTKVRFFTQLFVNLQS